MIYCFSIVEDGDDDEEGEEDEEDNEDDEDDDEDDDLEFIFSDELFIFIVC